MKILNWVKTLFKESVPEVAVPEVAVPEAALPEAEVPEAEVPEAEAPEAAVPEVAVPEVPEAEVPEEAAAEAEVPESVSAGLEMQNMMKAMAAKEAAQTYKMLHVFDNELVIVRGKDFDLKAKVSDVETEVNSVLAEIISIGNNSFEKNEIKTVNVLNDSNIVVFVKDKDMLRIEYAEFESALIESVVNAVKNVGNQ